MKKRCLLLCLTLAVSAWADEITFTAINFSHSTFSATAGELQFGNAINIAVTDNSTGKSIMLLGPVQSGSTGAATDFVPGPPLVADYSAGGADSVLVESPGHTFLSGVMNDSGRLEADYPDKAGAFLSRFRVTSLDPAILADLGVKGTVRPEGSVSLTLGQTSFDGTTLDATLGGSQITIETQAPVAEVSTMFLFATGVLLTFWSTGNRRKATP